MANTTVTTSSLDSSKWAYSYSGIFGDYKFKPLFTAPPPEQEKPDPWQWIQPGPPSDHKKYNILLITAEGFHKVVENIDHPGPAYRVPKQTPINPLGYSMVDAPISKTPQVMKFRYYETDENGFLVYKEEYY
jgi:hypothetical protein